MDPSELDEEAIFNAAKQFADPQQLAAYLDVACKGKPDMRQRIERLLGTSAEADDFFQRQAGPSETLPSDGRSTVVTPIFEAPGTVIGRYKVREKIGEGGCGVVYVAEQEEPVRRRVALKVIKLGMDTKTVVARFGAERQALAMMDHPNIAKVLDAGATETGRPYFVMELVRGIKITDYCDKNNLSTRERLDLFLQVCRAVQHAHQKGIIHRDLKPSNILVTLHDGVPVPKVIDFGIAKATEGRLTDLTVYTELNQFIGTPAYMSPEQAEMSGLDIDTRSDIYSLGVLLYELLTGKTPFDAEELLRAGLDQMRRTIREKEPVRPSTRLSTMLEGELTTTAKHRASGAPELIHLLRGDLDWIAMKALEKDRTRRYETANGLAMDIQRHLNQEPVVARPPSSLYRFQKLIQRNKLAFAAVAAVTIALVLGVVVSTWQAVRATRLEGQQSHLREAAQQAEAKAIAEERRATQEALQAKREKEAARQNAYLASMLLAQADWDNNNLPHLRQVLAETHDYPGRGFEWYYWRQLCHSELKTLTGHLGPQLQVLFSPDGKRIVTVSEDHDGKVWDVGSGREVFTLKGHRQVVRSLAYSPDGRRIATGTLGGDSTTKIWDAATGRELLQLKPHQGKVLTFSPDSLRIATLTDFSIARIWDVATGELLREVTGVVALSQDQDRVVTADQSGLLNVRTLSTGRKLCTIPNGSVVPRSGDDAGTPVAFSSDGRQLVVGNNQIAEVWDVDAGRKSLELRGHVGLILWARFSQDGQKIYTNGKEGTARVWDAKSGHELLTIVGTVGAISPDGRRIIASNENGSATVWDVNGGGPIRTLNGSVGACAFSPDGDRVVTCGAFFVGPGNTDNTVRIWETDKQPGLLILRPSPQAIRSVSISPDGRTFATAGDDNRATVWEAGAGRKLFVLVGHTASIRSVSFSTDGQRIATGSEDNTARLWDATTGQSTLTLEGHRGGVRAVAFSPDSRYLVTGSSDRTAKVWDIATGLEVRQLKGHKSGITAVSFSPDGQMLVTASLDRTARVWKMDTGQELRRFNGHEDGITSVSFSPDGRRIVTGSLDTTARVWDCTNSKALLTIEGNEGSIRSVAFSPDGRRIVIGNNDGTVAVWDPGMQRELLKLKGTDGAVHSVAFSATGRTIISGSADGTSRSWRAATGTQDAQWQMEEQAAEERLYHLADARAKEEEREQAPRSNDEGAIKHWLVLAPIPLEKAEVEQALENQQIPDEASLTPRAGEKFPIGGRELVWDEVNTADSVVDVNFRGWTRQYNSREVNLADTVYVIDFNHLLGESTEYSVAYAVCYIIADVEQRDLRMLIGSDDDSKVYLNGSQLYECPHGRSMVADADEVKNVRLNQGLNVLVFKVMNRHAGWQGSVRFTDKDGEPVKGIKVALSP
jgi:WD40 repeat protein/serine/threonine protein kinase